MQSYFVKGVEVCVKDNKELEELIEEMYTNVRTIISKAIAEAKEIKSKPLTDEGNTHVDYLTQYSGFQLSTGERIPLGVHNFIIAYTHKDERDEKIDCAVRVYEEWLNIDPKTLLEIFELYLTKVNSF